MKLVLLSDTHTQHAALELPEADVLIFAGDFSGYGTKLEQSNFVYWLRWEAPKFESVLVIAGNHDRYLEQEPAQAQALLGQVPNLTYLQDSGVEIEGVKFWGSPWTSEFKRWAFMRRPGFDLDRAWQLIPEDTRVLITHSPAAGFLDQGSWPTTIGCEMLAHRLGPEGNLKPVLHVCGHAHSGYGQTEENGILRVNAGLCDEYSRLVPSRKPIELDLPLPS